MMLLFQNTDMAQQKLLSDKEFRNHRNQYQ